MWAVEARMTRHTCSGRGEPAATEGPPTAAESLGNKGVSVEISGWLDQAIGMERNDQPTLSPYSPMAAAKRAMLHKVFN